MQTLYLATNFNPIYWNTACLVVDSGSLEDASEEEIVGIYEPEADDLTQGVTFTDLPDRKGKIRKTSSTDYTKLAKAIGAIRSAGIDISLVNINKSDFGFKPDAENNRILFGMKGLLNVGDDLINDTIKLRPFASPKDYLLRAKPKRQSMIALIKAGAFDEMMDRKLCMGWYIWETCDKKSRLTLQNMSSLLKYNLIPDDEGLAMSKKVFEFNRYLKSICKLKSDLTYYHLDDRATAFLNKIGQDELIGQTEDDFSFIMNMKAWDKVYQSYMDTVRSWLAENKDKVLMDLNTLIFKEDWDKYATGNLSAWEMEVLCFYYHDHELANINKDRYDISNFNDLPEHPEVESSFFKGGFEVKKFRLSRICGTCIAKNKTKGIVSLLTTDGVVDVKFRKEYFALFDKQISEKGADGVKHKIEGSWFNRGNMIIVNGMRDGDSFFVKKYNTTQGHRLYRITKVFDNGEVALQTERYNGGEMEDV